MKTTDEELELLRANAERADLLAAAEKNVSCCYARGNKYWYTDPQGIAWETYHTLEQIELFRTSADKREQSDTDTDSNCGSSSKAASARCGRPIDTVCC